MGQLPLSRVTPCRPLYHVGVDYAGPLTLKTFRGRGAKTYKGYFVIFICFSTSAIHLEVATDYSTEGFLAAFKRFLGRRGICSTLTSDCGTNLVGADAELQRLFRATSREWNHIASRLANDGVTWKFNPSSAPHFGGNWEAGVKSVKFHLRRVIGEAFLTYEEMTTLLVQIEAILNSRPLSTLSDEPVGSRRAHARSLLGRVSPDHRSGALGPGDAAESTIALAATTPDDRNVLEPLVRRVSVKVLGRLKVVPDPGHASDRSAGPCEGRTTAAHKVASRTDYRRASRT
ncbi:uncharacterized protein LOC105200091 [Solenopsis invicta]|uniref:uncharacterized protein LOC105200091 n=1 Tax=Solenopsis invicta TaxID=13686 RepID=UPI000595E739|nr:uncharacterized protein LOC105200091 [Solenopsis invicta]